MPVMKLRCGDFSSANGLEWIARSEHMSHSC
jgi:hypothetical protein